MPGKSQTKKILRPSGVYQIRCLITGQIYIGSAVNMPARWSEHRRRLQRGVHANQHLQQAWNKYGEENFELDFPSMHRLAKGKSKLKSYKGWTHRNSVRKRAYVKTYDGFIDPAGQPAGTITNLAAFCRERGLDTTHMVAVANGRICSHRGWTHKDGRQKSEPKVYTGFINPDGQRVIITNLRAFCRGHGLHPVRMHQLKNGQRKSHKGWTWREE
jgi:hypothetical protein